MKHAVFPGPRSGTVKIPASKSMAHRLLIAAALGKRPKTLHFDGFSNDIGATIAELCGGDWRVAPAETVSDAECSLFCGESGSTLRFLLPIVGVLGANAVFHMEGRLPERPLEPLRTILCEHGMNIEKTGDLLVCSGKLSAEIFEIPGNVSSQYIKGLLTALPLLPTGATLRVTGNVESAAYIAMTEQVLRMADIRFEKTAWDYAIPGSQLYALPERVEVEGDWSNAAFFLSMGALSPAGVRVAGLHRDSAQGDRAVLDILRAMGAEVTTEEGAVTVRRGALRGVTIDARPIPDLIPVLSVLAALAEGETVIEHAGRLASTAARLTALGGQVTELPEGLRIQGMPQLAGGTVDACNDHRIAMAAAVAAGGCRGNVVVQGSECVNKSYPDFWRDLDGLKGAEA